MIKAFSLKSLLQNYRAAEKPWFAFVFFAIILIISPILSLFRVFTEEKGNSWNHIVDNLLPDYTLNSIILVVLVSLLSLVFAVSSAWVNSNYVFPGSKFFKWGQVLPLAFPTYIISFIYVDIFSYGGEFSSLVELISFGLIESYSIDIVNIYSLSLILSLVLYPYVYIPLLGSFEKNNSLYIDAAQSMGVGNRTIFWKLILPLSRPAMFGGLFLLSLEVLNDYGAMQYFGIQTYTTGIFKAWFASNDLNSGLRLSLLLMGLVLIMYFLERALRGRRSYKVISNYKASEKEKLLGKKAFFAAAINMLPFVFGFLFPFLKLLSNIFSQVEKIADIEFLSASLNTILVAFVSTVLILVFAIIISYSKALDKSGIIKKISGFISVGYAVPGAVLAVGLISFSMLISGKYILVSGSLSILIFAYLVRFMAISYNNIDNGFKSIGDNLRNASVFMNISRLKSLLKLELPLLNITIAGAFILVFVDILKELPLTLILRPFNYDTMATLAYQYASDEMMYEASLYSVFIVFFGLIPLSILNKLKT